MPDQNNEQLQVNSNPRLEAMRGLLSEEELSELEKQVTPNNTQEQGSGGEGQGQENQNQGTEGAEGGTENNGGEGNGAEGAEGQGAEGEENKGGAEGNEADTKKQTTPATEKKSILGIKTTKKGSDLVIEKPEDILVAVKSKYGIELKEIKDFPKFFESVDKTRVKAQNADKLEEENINLKKLWEELLPSEFVEAAKAHLSGEDFRKVLLQRAPFDFKQPAEKQDAKALVNYYFPNKFTDADFAEETPSQALEIAKQASLDKFKIEKQAHDNKSVGEAKRAQERLESSKKAITNSLSYLKQSFPDTDEGVVTSVKEILEGGPQSVLNLVFNSDGTAKEDAAEKLLMLLHGKSEISTMMEIASSQTETRINEELLTRSADTTKPVQKTGGKGPQISEETKQKLEELERLEKQSQKTF